MRIAIYALTFMTYAYSGYGSNLIHNLRDAIIAAEAVFGDVLRNTLHVVRKFQTVHQVFDAAVEETCVYKCPGGRPLTVFFLLANGHVPFCRLTLARSPRSQM